MEPYRSFDEILAARLGAVAKSLRQATPPELHQVATHYVHGWIRHPVRAGTSGRDRLPRRNWCSIREPVVEWYMFDKRLKKLCGVGRISDDNMKGLTQLVSGRNAPPS